MSISLRPITVRGTPAGREFKVFGNLIFSGNYVVGGDSVALDTATAPNPGVGFLERPFPSVSLPPIDWEIRSDALGQYTFQLVPVSGALDFLIKVFKTSGSLIFSAVLSPAAVAANTTAEQLFTVTGVTTSMVVDVNKPTAQAGLGIVGARVSAANQVGITFSNNTAAAITPTAGETYKFLAAGGIFSSAELAAGAYPADLAADLTVKTKLEYRANI